MFTDCLYYGIIRRTCFIFSNPSFAKWVQIEKCQKYLREQDFVKIQRIAEYSIPLWRVQIFNLEVRPDPAISCTSLDFRYWRTGLTFVAVIQQTIKVHSHPQPFQLCPRARTQMGTFMSRNANIFSKKKSLCSVPRKWHWKDPTECKLFDVVIDLNICNPTDECYLSIYDGMSRFETIWKLLQFTRVFGDLILSESKISRTIDKFYAPKCHAVSLLQFRSTTSSRFETSQFSRHSTNWNEMPGPKFVSSIRRNEGDKLALQEILAIATVMSRGFCAPIFFQVDISLRTFDIP